MRKDADKIVEQLPNGPGVVPRTLLRGCYKGMLPNSMCEVPYLLTAEIETIELTSDSEAALRGTFSYLANSTFGYQIEFGGNIDFISHELSLAEERSNPDEAFTYSGRLSTNGRVIHLHASQSDGFQSDRFYLIHEDSIQHLIELKGA